MKLVDGTTITLPNTQTNKRCFPQNGNQTPGVGFPLGVISLTTGAVLDAAVAPYQGKGTDESSLFRRLQACLVVGDVSLVDACFCSYFLMADLQDRRVDVLFEQQGARYTDFRQGERL